MTDDQTNRRVLLASRPVGEPTPDDFRIVSEPVPGPADDEVLLRTVYLSLDPYMRGRMSAATSYAPPVEVGDVMVGGTVGRVVESRASGLDVGDLVLSYSGWQTHSVEPARAVRKLDPSAAPPSTAVGVL
ncbi:MAG: NADP-dependent oxidoreductase, partial [Nocardioidaceae bacterium]